MRTTRWIGLAVLLAILCAAIPALGESDKAYQVTGPVVEVTKDMIVVMKGKDRWEIARDASSKVPADVKAGDKVTVYYRMTATEVESKAAAKPPAKAKKAA
jgi:RNase P/RNase MRP subunit p29